MIYITLQFDRKARYNNKVQQRLVDIFNINPSIDVNNMVVKPYPSNLAREFIARYHYSHIMPDSSKEIYAGFFENTLAGIVVYGTGASNEAFTSLFKGINLYETRELVRLWSPDGMPKNTESKLISETFKLLPKEVKVIISFADPTHRHLGIIYQATNFYYVGMTKPSKVLINDKGEIFHSRTIGSYKRRHPELIGLSHKEIMAKFGWMNIDKVGKHKYIFLRGTTKERKHLLKEINGYILPYPKTAEQVSRADIPSIQEGEVEAVSTLRT